jgi:hypothetical protein
LITPYIAPKNRFYLDTSTEFIGLTDTTVIFANKESPDLRYLLALLNSCLLTFRYRYIGKAKDYRFEYFENGLKKIPIRSAPAKIERELIELAQRMLDLNFVRQVLYDEYQTLLKATIHTTRDFYGAYFTHSEYQDSSIHLVGSADANARGTVTHISVSEVGTQLIVEITEEDAGELRLVTLDVPEDNFRHFLLLGLRADLLANGRKQIWARGRLLQGTLTAIRVPVLVGASALANLEQIKQFMIALQQRVSKIVSAKLGKRTESIGDLLNLGLIERELSSTDQMIDEIVYKLYGVTNQEDINLIQDILR